MEKQEHITKIDQRIRLKSDGQDALYENACAGSEGWVRKQEIDNLGYPMIYVEWDRDHWTYNGETDRWAMESHFDPVEEKMSEQEFSDEEYKQFQEFQKFKRMREAQEGDQPRPEKVPEVIPDRLTTEQYNEMVDQGATLAKSADAFILIAIDRRDREDGPIPSFTPAAVTAYKSPESGHIAELQLAKLATLALEGLTVDAVKRLVENES